MPFLGVAFISTIELPAQKIGGVQEFPRGLDDMSNQFITFLLISTALQMKYLRL